MAKVKQPKIKITRGAKAMRGKLPKIGGVKSIGSVRVYKKKKKGGKNC